MSLASKLNLKEGQRVLLLNVPKGVELDLPRTTGTDAEAGLVFATNKQELSVHGGPIFAMARNDRIAWVAYPKAGQLGTDLNRDILWKELEREKIKPVRQVAIDDVWSALRFRPQ